MPVRTSTRQAAVKANQAFTQGPAGSKRKASAPKSSLTKKGRKDEEVKGGGVYEKPSVTEEAQEIRPSEIWSDEQATANEQPTEAAPQKEAEQPTDGIGKDEEKPKEDVTAQEAKQEPTKEKEEKEREEKEREEKEREEREREEKEKEEREREEKEREEKEKEKKEKEEKEQTSEFKEAGTAVKDSPERERIVPSNILEKGIIYFFYRPRVNVQDPNSMNEIARSFFVLRPTPKGAKLESGFIGDENNCRLMILPKKKFPTSGRERDMGFVEKAKVSLKTLREEFIAKDTYVTKTRGEQTTPDARPYAEGVYAIVKEGRSSHLAYILTIPKQIDDIQRDFGLYNRGSFIFQIKNPKYAGPTYAQLPKGPEYPEEIMTKFHDLRWVPVEPEFLDYPNAQFLMIGEAHDGLGKGGEARAEGDMQNKENPAEELDKFEGENEERVDSLGGDHTVFNDLGIDAEKHADLPRAWE